MYKIMLADDEGIVIDSLSFIIEKEFGISCQIESAKTGRNVIELAERFRPDIAFMDIQMPIMNGYDAAKSIRQLPRKDAQTVWIVAMTANAFVEDIRLSQEAGMNEHCSKPVNADRLHEILRKHFSY